MDDREFKADIFSKTAAEWTAENPFLARNDLGVESDTGLQKIGVGQRWSATSYTPSAEAATSGLTITKAGDWVPFSIGPSYRMIAPLGLLVAGAYKRYTGKWVDTVTYTDSNIATSGITSMTFDDLEGAGNVLLLASYATSASFPALKYIGGWSVSLPQVTSLSLPALEYVAANFGLSSMCLLTVSLPALVHVTGNFSVTSMSVGTTSISLPSLRVVGGDFFGSVGGLSSLTTFSFPVLEKVNAAFMPAGLSALSSISAPSLQYVGGAIGDVGSMTALTTVSLPALVAGGGGISYTGTHASLASFTLPVDGRLKVMAGNVSVTGAALTQASVDNIMQALAALDGTNGTTAFSTGRTINVSGGTSAAPTSVSETTTPGSNFSCSGTTCTVTLTAHGYTTGDVLRVSGVTTATNANRYAVITVTGVNTFTYTITSQTATGAGTATIRKANDNVKALVTRGVTLTTN